MITKESFIPALTILIHFPEAKWKETLSFEMNKFHNQLVPSTKQLRAFSPQWS